MTTRIPPARLAQTLLVLSLGLVSACHPNQTQARMSASSPSIAQLPMLPVDTPALQPHPTSSRNVPAPTLDSLASAYQQFASFLELAVATRKDLEGLDSIYSRGSLEDLGLTERDEDMRWLAASRIISVRTSGDSGRAVALITTVARQVPESEEGHYAVRFEIQNDTAQWLIVRSADTGGRWKVYGEGWIVGHPRDQFSILPVGRDLHWVTGSRAQALAAVDSIRLARGLAIVR